MFNLSSTRMLKLTRHCGLWRRAPRSYPVRGDQAAASRVQSKELRSTSGDVRTPRSASSWGSSPRSLAMLPTRSLCPAPLTPGSGSARIRSCTASQKHAQQGQSSALSNSLVIGHFRFGELFSLWIGFQFPKADFSLIFSRNEDFRGPNL